MITVVSLGIIIINLYLFARSFSIPIIELKDSLHSLAYASEANLASRLRITSRDELGEIAYSFNLFISTIETIIRKSHKISDSVTASAQEISMLSGKFDNSNAILSHEITDVSASIEEISAVLESVADLAGQQSKGISDLVEYLQKWDGITQKMSDMQADVMRLAESTANRARSGDDALQKTSHSMHSIQASADKITEVVGIIRGVSEKVDLLALNASIEAARAGESGRGFAVVAEEISRLAVKTADSIKEIDSHVQANTVQVKVGVEHVDSTTRMIAEIMNDTKATSGKIHDLDGLMSEQLNINSIVQKDAVIINQKAIEIQQSTSEERKSLDSVNKAVDKISQISQDTTQASQLLMKDAEENEKIAEVLRESIRRFKIG
jgi:methyl-accepting chemotaxis protein